jgi:RNA polymerase sigma factor (sigma-70 family)
LVESETVIRTETRVVGEQGVDFEHFFADEYPRLVRALFLLVGDRTEAEDVAQEALARTFERWERVKRMDSPEGYVYRMAFNLNRRRLRTVLRERARLPLRSEAVDATAAADIQRDIIEAIRHLPLGEREAIVASAWLGMSAEEIATVLGIKVVSVRSRLHRARKAIQTLIGDGYERSS